MSADITVSVAPGTYYLDEPLTFTAADSGQNGYRVIWEGTDANISGGLPVRDWEVHDAAKNIYAAHVPTSLQTRHLFVDQKHAQRARRALDRSWLNSTEEAYYIVNEQANFILSLPDLESAEIRAINSFTDRYSRIDRLGGNGTIMMKQPAFHNNRIGWDTIISPFDDHGFFVENSLALLDEENEWYLDSQAGTIYYKPSNGSDINTMSLVVGKLEQLLVLSGTYDDPVHDLIFRGFNYMHTTWNSPTTSGGYVDQQTGGYINDQVTYDGSDFEASRPNWWQIPGSIQVSAAKNVVFQNGSLVALMGGIGIGNDENAHVNGVGLGTSDIEISGMNFIQTGANAITVGGIQADAHHPSDDRMINRQIRILENIFTQVAQTVTSCVPIFATYTENTHIVHNDISNVPYSGICYGYGWGSNDAGGSEEYALRGLYNHQPRYTTPTVLANGYIAKNLIQTYGLQHSDLGGVYTLSKSPNTSITENWILAGERKLAAIYHDEGSRDYRAYNSVVDAVRPNWLWRNLREFATTGNLTIYNITTNQPIINGTNEYGDSVFNITRWSTYSDLTPEQQSWVANAGIPADQRSSRPDSTNAHRP